MSRDWGEIKRHAHRPAHWTAEQGSYIVTAGTLGKQHYFHTVARLDFVAEALQARARRWGMTVEAWAVFSNHYHLVVTPDDPACLPRFVAHLHADTSRQVNREDGEPGRKVWYQYWDTFLDSEKAYYSRLHYVVENPVHHGLVQRAEAYPWCAARELFTQSDRQFRDTVLSFATDRVEVRDEFEPLMPC